MKHMLIASCCALLVAGACKKKDDDAAPENKPAENKPAENKPVEQKPEPAKPAEIKPAEPAATVTIASDADYEAKGLDLMQKMGDVIAAAGTDCPKLASSVSKFLDDNKPTIDAVSAYEKAHPDVEKAVDKKNKAKTKELEKKVDPSMKACAKDQAVAEAFAKLPLGK
jgi:hypothetical protein